MCSDGGVEFFEFIGDEFSDDVAAFGVEVGVVDIAGGGFGGEGVEGFLAHGFVEGDGGGVEVDDGDVLGEAELFYGFDVGDEGGVAFVVIAPGAAAEGGDEDGGGADGAGFVDVDGHVIGVGGGGGGFEFGAFTGLIVVAELEEDDVGFGVEAFLPVAFEEEAFGGATIAGEIEAFGVGGELLGEAGTPAGGGADGGVAGEDDFEFGG